MTRRRAKPRRAQLSTCHVFGHVRTRRSTSILALVTRREEQSTWTSTTTTTHHRLIAVLDELDAPEAKTIDATAATETTAHARRARRAISFPGGRVVKVGRKRVELGERAFGFVCIVAREGRENAPIKASRIASLLGISGAAPERNVSQTKKRLPDPLKGLIRSGRSEAGGYWLAADIDGDIPPA